MTMSTHGAMRVALTTGRESVKVFLGDVGHGLLDVSHNMLAMVGLAVVAAALFVGGQPEMRDTLEAQAWGWLQARHLARSGGEDLAAVAEGAPATGADGATAADPAELDRSQSAVAHWIARRYHVAPEPVARLVQESWTVGQRTGLEPTLILAVMAVESSFNPFAQSAVGAQGLMQVMTRVHTDKYAAFGGRLAAFDPVSNLRVGVQVLKECIQKAGGGLEPGLRFYVGAGNADDDGGYALKVIAERQFLLRVAAGQTVPVTIAAAVPAAHAATPAGIAASQAAPEGEAAQAPPAEQVAQQSAPIAAAVATPGHERLALAR